MIHNKSTTLKSAISFVLFAFFLGHVNRLRSSGRFDYDYNMKANVATGVFTGIGWLVWYFGSKETDEHAWKVCYVQLLAGCSLLLELMDFPPIWFTFDAHSLWHLCTVPLTMLFYRWVELITNKIIFLNRFHFSFIIDDCKRLRAKTINDVEEMKKLI